MDDAIERIVDALKENGLWDDTVFVFTTDNGAQLSGGGGEPGRPGFDVSFTMHPRTELHNGDGKAARICRVALPSSLAKLSSS
jgi:hypothetical protein